MGNSRLASVAPSPESLDRQIGAGLRRLRQAQGWSLDDLAARSGVSRATLSRLENAEVSATTAVLCKLAGVFGLTASRLLYNLEEEARPVLRRSEQPLWQEPGSGYLRRAVSPPATGFKAEVIEAEIPANTRLAYDGPHRPGLEHHLIMLEGALTMTIEGAQHDLRAGDCLRFVLYGSNVFETPPMSGARYLLVLV